MGVDVAGDNVLNAVGDIIDYEIDVTNDGNVTLTNVTVTDPLTGGSSGDLRHAGPGRHRDGRGLLRDHPGRSRQQRHARAKRHRRGFIDNVAVADSDETPPVDDTESVPVAGAPVLLIDKRVVGVDVAGDNVLNAVGDIIDYEIDVTNDGNVTLTNVTSPIR